MKKPSMSPLKDVKKIQLRGRPMASQGYSMFFQQRISEEPIFYLICKSTFMLKNTIDSSGYLAVTMPLLMPILTRSICFCLYFGMQLMSWWACRNVIFRGGHCIIFALVAVWWHQITHCTNLLLLYSQQASIRYAEGAYVRNSGYALIQGYKVQADWWPSLGSMTLPVRSVLATITLIASLLHHSLKGVTSPSWLCFLIKIKELF